MHCDAQQNCSHRHSTDYTSKPAVLLTSVLRARVREVASRIADSRFVRQISEHFPSSHREILWDLPQAVFSTLIIRIIQQNLEKLVIFLVLNSLF